VHVHGSAQDLLLDPSRVGEGVSHAAVLQFGDDGQKAVVGREKAAKLNVVGPEPGELRFLIDAPMGVEPDKVEKHKQGIGRAPQCAAHLFFELTVVGYDAHQRTPAQEH
jgi:hypothetical protein